MENVSLRNRFFGLTIPGCGNYIALSLLLLTATHGFRVFRFALLILLLLTGYGCILFFRSGKMLKRPPFKLIFAQYFCGIAGILRRKRLDRMDSVVTLAVARILSSDSATACMVWRSAV